MAFNREKIEAHVQGILEAIGENPNREGLKETPARVARMLEEVLEGVSYTNNEIAAMFNKAFEEDVIIPAENNEMVMLKDIEIFSFCEHHLALMYNMKVTIAYIPKGKILGISKLVRIADMVGKRLQLQERIGSDIAEIMQQVSGSEDVAVLIAGQHACMTTRGIKNTKAVTVTTTLRGSFHRDKAQTEQFMSLAKS